MSSNLRESLSKRRREGSVRAIKKFNTMIPALRQYARTESGNPKLQLKAGPVSQTDGNTIFICPPVRLGMERKHNSMCDEYEFSISMCPACAAQDELMMVLRHEIGHLVHGSLEPVRGGQAIAMTRRCGAIGSEQQTLFEKSVYDNPKGYSLVHVSSLRDPYISMATLMAEDLRCDEARLVADPAQREAFFSYGETLLIEGIERDSGERTHYTQLDEQHQAVMAFMFYARGHDVDGYFNAGVVEALEDPRFRPLAVRCLNAPDSTESFGCALELVDLFNEFDLCDFDYDKSKAEYEDLMEEVAEILRAILGHGMEIGGHPGAGGGSGEGNTGDEGLRPEDIDRAMRALATLGEVPINVGAPIVRKPSGRSREGGAYWDHSIDFQEPMEKFVAPAINAARLAFDANARVQRQKNQKSGRVSGKMLARRVPFKDERMFASKVVPDKRNYHIVIGMDVSGSSSGQTLRREKTAVFAMANVCDRLGLSFEVWAHTTDWEGEAYSSQDCPELYCLKGDRDPWGPDQKDNLRKLCASGANFDGHTLRFYRRRVEAVRATDKIIMYYTDGAMPAGNYEEELSVLKAEIDYCKKNDITLMAVGMGVDSPKEHGFDTAVINSEADFRKVVDHLGKRLMK